jgi:thymidylate kinase
MFWRAFSGIVLADRYFFDYYYMLGYVNCPKWYLDVISVLVPKPDLLFALERPAEEIYAQKPELEVGEIKRQQQAIHNALSEKHYMRIIDASQGIDETVRRVSREIELWLVSQASK